MKRIAFVITDLSYGGAQTMLVQLLKNLDKDEYTTKVYVRERKLDTSIEHEIEELGIEIRYLQINDNNFSGSKILHKLRAFKEFRKTLNEFKPDIVHAHLESFYSILYCVFEKCKYIFTIHSFPDRIMTKQFVFLLNILKRMKKLVLIGCAKCVSVKSIEILGDSFAKCTNTVYNPIDYAAFDIKKSRNGNVFLHVGRMNPIKNQSLLIEAFSEFATKFPNSYLLMVGDGELRKELENQVSVLNMKNNIIFLGNRPDMGNIMSKSDCFILTSKSECCPMSILEAMASELPVISTDVGGISEIAGESAIFIEDKVQLVAALEKMYLDDEYRLQMGSCARKLSKKFDSKNITSEYENIYVSIC